MHGAKSAGFDEYRSILQFVSSFRCQKSSKTDYEISLFILATTRNSGCSSTWSRCQDTIDPLGTLCLARVLNLLQVSFG